MSTPRKYYVCRCGIVLPRTTGRPQGQHYKFCSDRCAKAHRLEYWRKYYRALYRAARANVGRHEQC